MAPLPVGQGSKEPARGGVLGVSSATSFFLEFPLLLPRSRKGDHFELLGVSVPIWEVDENNSAAS